MSVCKAAKLFGVPESTLRDRTLGLQSVPDEKEGFLSNPGPAPTFSKTEESDLVAHADYMSTIGYGYSKKEFLRLATDYALSLGKKSESDPEFGISWFERFKARNPQLTLVKPQKLSIQRAKATSEPVLKAYFTELENVLTSNGLLDQPANIWNLDETGIVTEHSPTNVLCLKGNKPQAISSSRGKTVTIIAGGNAAGNRIPPFYVFPGKRWMDDLLQDASPGSKGTVTESGWSNSMVFLHYMEHHFLKHVPTSALPTLVMLDGHKSHVNLTLRDWGKEHNIVFFLLPPHTSHVTQPLDVGCFGPLKKAYYTECQAFLRSIPGLQINRYNVAKLSSKAYNKALTPDNLIASFKKTGIYPLQRHAITPEKTAPSTIYQSTDTSQPSTETTQTFLDSRKITQPVTSEKKRKHQSITGNLMSPSKNNVLKDITNTSEPSKKKQSKQSKFQPPYKQSTSYKSPIPTSPKPSTSGLHQHLDSFSDDQSEIAEEDLCCVCKKIQPEAMCLKYTVEFVKWGQCDQCNHWVHLKYCSSVKILRRKDSFFCPCCENEP